MAHVTRIATTLDGKDYSPGDVILGAESFPNFQLLVDCHYLAPISDAEAKKLIKLQKNNEPPIITNETGEPPAVTGETGTDGKDVNEGDVDLSGSGTVS